MLVVKNLPANAGDARDAGLIPRSRRSPGVENGNPLQYSCLDNPMANGARRATVHGITKSQTQVSMCTCAHTHTHTHTNTANKLISVFSLVINRWFILFSHVCPKSHYKLQSRNVVFKREAWSSKKKHVLSASEKDRTSDTPRERLLSKGF